MTTTTMVTGTAMGTTMGMTTMATATAATIMERWIPATGATPSG